jgi:lysophospholipase L1-like esterase
VRPRQLGVVSRDYREYCRLWPQRPRLTSLKAIETYLRFHESINYHVRTMLHRDHDEQNVFRTGSEVFRANIRDMVALARSRGVRVLLICPRFRDLTGGDSDLASTHPTSWAVAQHRAAVAEIGRELDVPVLDMMELMPKPPSSKAEASPYFLDPIHMAAEGTKVFAGHVATRLHREIAAAGP